MMKKTNTALLGVFVLGALALIVCIIVILGSGRFFSNTPVYVMFFSGSVKGLNEGAAVVFRGVQVGKVTDISLSYDTKGGSVQIPVLVEIDPRRIMRDNAPGGSKDFLMQLVGQGLCAQLQIQNLLTGQLTIELDFRPNSKRIFVRSPWIHYPEIPTVPSSMEQLSKTFEKLPVEELLRKLISAVEGMEKAVTSPDIVQSMHALNLAINDVRHLVQNLDTKVDPLAADMHGTMQDTRLMIQDVHRQSLELKASLQQASDSSRLAMQQIERTAQSLEQAGSVDAPLMRQLSASMQELSATAASIRALSEYLARHPEALLRGK